MAKKASTDRVQADMSPPNFRAAVQQLRSIKPKKDKLSGINGEIAAIYGRIEGYKVNAKAAKIFYPLDNMEHSERMEIMRALNGLMDAAGWEESAADLADKAENKVVHMRMPASRENGDDDNGDGFEMSPEELAKQTDRKAAKPKPAKPSTVKAVSPPAQEPYLGDNSDLNPDGNA